MLYDQFPETSAGRVGAYRHVIADLRLPTKPLVVREIMLYDTIRQAGAAVDRIVIPDKGEAHDHHEVPSQKSRKQREQSEASARWQRSGVAG